MMFTMLALFMFVRLHSTFAAPAILISHHSVPAKMQRLHFRYWPQRSATFLHSPSGLKFERIQLGPLTTDVKDYYDRSVALHPNGRFLYASNGHSADVEQYRIRHGRDIVSLHPPTVDAASHPGDISFHPNGRFVYISCSHGAICQYRVGRSGELVPLSPQEVYVSNDPFPLRFDRSGRFACVIADGSDNTGRIVYVYRVNRSGTLTLLRRIHAGDIDISLKEVLIRGNRVSTAK